MPGARVADEKIDGTKLGLGRLDQRVYLAWVAQITPDGNRLPSHATGCLGNRACGLLLMSIADRQISPGFGQAQSRRSSNPTARPRNERHASVKIHTHLLRISFQ